MHAESSATPELSVALEAVLRRHASVADCAIVRRQDLEGRSQLLAYVVLAGPYSEKALRSHLQQHAPGQTLPDAFIPVSALPIDLEGRVSFDRLAKVPVIDQELINRWQRELRRQDGVGEVRVFAQPRTLNAPHFHLSHLAPESLLNERSSPGAGAEPPSAEADPAARSEDAGVALSICDGGCLQPPAGIDTLSDALSRAAEQWPAHGLHFLREDLSTEVKTYARLLEESLGVLAGLQQQGLRAGDKVLFQVTSNENFLTLFWGCVLGGIVPVPLSASPAYEPSNATVRKLRNAWQMLEQPLIVADRSLTSAIRSVFAQMDAEHVRVEGVEHLAAQSSSARPHAASPDDLALILLTSGSTGMPKAVMHSHRTLLNRSFATARFNGFTSDDLSLNWMPLDHVGGIVMFHLRDVCVGCRQIHAPTELILSDPLKWLEAIARHRATVTWAPNFAFALINDRAADLASRSWDLSCMRFILNGGEAIVPRTARRFLELLIPFGLPPDSMRPAWGMSETASGVVYADPLRLDTTRDDDHYAVVGRPVPGVSLRIVDGDNRIVPEGVAGQLQVKGATLTLGYYKNPEANAAIASDGWFATGDQGVIRDGCLTITGRVKDEIIINGINFVGSEIEAVVETLAGLKTSFTAACAYRAPGGNTDALAVFFCPESDRVEELPALLDAIRKELGENVGVVPSALIPLPEQEIPKTAIGKIQRSRLRERLENGDYADILKRVAEVEQADDTVPEWFFRQVWRRRERPHEPLEKPGNVLLFADDAGLWRTLRDDLVQRGWTCTVVEAAADFSQPEEGRFTLSPREPEHYRELLSTVLHQGPPIDRIIHLWTYREQPPGVKSVDDLRRAQDRGALSLLSLIRALSETIDGMTPIRLLVFGSGAQCVERTDTSVSEHATCVGLLKAASRELSWLHSRHVDLEVAEPAANVAAILRELQILDVDDEIAYRGARRFVWGLSRVDLRKQASRALPLREGGLYLMTGGLGAVGNPIARQLMEHFRAKLLLVSPSPLPPEDEWPSLLRQGGPLAERIAACQRLRETGCEVMHEAVDVADLPALQAAVGRAVSRWGQDLDGVFHLAAGADDADDGDPPKADGILTETLDSFDAMLRRKVYCTWSLYELLRDRPDALIVSFGSATQLFGEASLASGAAGESFLSNWCRRQRSSGRSNTFLLEWAGWGGDDRTSREMERAQESCRNAGYASISPRRAWACLLGGLLAEHGDLMIGLDARSVAVRQRLGDEVQPLAQLSAFCTTHAGPPAVEVREAQVVDRFGNAVPWSLEIVDTVPRADFAERAWALSEVTVQASQPPRDEIERRVAAIWTEVLGASPSGVDDWFFGLGGNSLAATQVLSRISKAFGVRVSLREFFQLPTVAELARLIRQRRQPDEAAPASDTIEKTDDYASMLEQVDELKEEQLTAMLAKMQRGHKG